MARYQEILTDPSHAEQIVVMTAAQVGTYSMNAADDESGDIHPAGFVAREFSRAPEQPRARIHMLDGGMKRNQLLPLVKAGCSVELFPENTPADLLGKKPLSGVGLGHQQLGLALGADTFKLRSGHRGGDHPVGDNATGRIDITIQTLGFCVPPKEAERAGGTVTHANLNNGTLEGFSHADLRLAFVQLQPEAMPGPRDAEHLLVQRFLQIAGV
jgi:carbamoylphosphate synthase small subunit